MSNAETEAQAIGEIYSCISVLNYACRDILRAAEAVITSHAALAEVKALGVKADPREFSEAQLRLTLSQSELADEVRIYLVGQVKLQSVELGARRVKGHVAIGVWDSLIAKHGSLLAEVDAVSDELDDVYLSSSVHHVEVLMKRGVVQKLQAHLETVEQELLHKMWEGHEELYHTLWES